ncbi:arabinogalactan peptide 13 [Artemisia annua]|uniref:Arabinogalactan peptide 13 n=1 Tax=Artemisia annua TaxID=35608 RepID=A0A2U1PBY9_ARTAN|nr:arabinogalactan peptide 13 [Artemisia annua]
MAVKEKKKINQNGAHEKAIKPLATAVIAKYKLSLYQTGSPVIISTQCGPSRAALPEFSHSIFTHSQLLSNHHSKFLTLFQLHTFILFLESVTHILFEMESMRMNLLVACIVMLMAVSAVSNVAAQEAPAPAPTSDAATFVPTAVASIVALAFGFLF